MAETPFARNRFKRMMLVAKGLPIEEVNLAVPMIMDKFTNMQDARIAMFENDMFFTTNEILIAGTDDDIVHLDIHLPKCARVIQATQEGVLAPVDSYKYLENNLAHSLQHVEQLGKNPIFNKKATEYATQLKDLNTAKESIKAAAERMMKQQQEQASKLRLDPETEADIANKNAKTMSDAERKDWLAKNRTEQRNKQIDLDHEAKLKEIDLNNQLQLAKDGLQ